MQRGDTEPLEHPPRAPGTRVVRRDRLTLQQPTSHRSTSGFRGEWCQHNCSMPAGSAVVGR